MFDTLTDMNLLYNSFRKCCKGVRWKCSTQRYELNFCDELYKLRKALLNGTYKQKPFCEFNINERGKQRHIKSLHISDRVLQRCLCDNILIPTFYKYLIYDNGASVKGKGIEFTRKRLETHLQKYYRKHGSKGYILLIDFSKFFDSIPHDELLKLIRKRIDDDKTYNLIEYLIKTFDDGEHKSLGIGSQISQIFGIYYPTRLDNYIKIVKGCKFYGRYMDDLYIVHEDKQFLKDMLEGIKQVAEELKLTINLRKTQICRIDKGFTFLKTRYFITESGRIVKKPCKKNIVRQRQKLKKLKKKMDVCEISFEDIFMSYKSWRGTLRRYDSYHVLHNMDNLFDELFGKELYEERKSFRPKGCKKNTR